MQPILILAIVAVAAIGLGTGFLNNDFIVMVQQFGIGQGNINTPIEKATVDFHIDSVKGQDNFYKNVIDYCTITLDADNTFGVRVGPTDSPNDNPTGTKTSELWCKLTDMNHNVIAEGVMEQDVFGVGPHKVPITTTPLPLAVDVDDVTIIAHANEYDNQIGYQPAP